MSNEKVVTVTADARGLLGMSPAAADVMQSNSRVQIQLTRKDDVATLDIVNAGHCVVTSPSNLDLAQWKRFQSV